MTLEMGMMISKRAGKLWIGFAIVVVLLLMGLTFGGPTRRTVTLATVGTTKPFSYTEDGKLTGYEIELARAIFKDSEQFDLKIKKTEWASIFDGIKENYYQIGASSISKSSDRMEHMLFSSPIAYQTTVLVVNKNSGIRRFEDVATKKTQVIHGTTTAHLLEVYNKKYPKNKVRLTYTNESIDSILENINEGQYDFKLFDQLTARRVIQEKHLTQLTEITKGLPKFDDSEVHYIFSPDEKALQYFVNERLKVLCRDGTVKRLSEQYLKDSEHHAHNLPQ